MKSLKTQVEELEVKLKNSQKNEFKTKAKIENKQGMSEPGNKPSEFKKISSQDHGFPTKSQKTDLTCTICSKTFSKKTSLKKHIEAVHEGLKPFECPTCKKSFYEISHLKAHISEVHDKIKNFQCPKCDKKFGRKNHVNEHVAVTHDKIKRDHGFPTKSQKTDLTCTICSKTFSKKSKLKVHIAAVHEGLKPF